MKIKMLKRMLSLILTVIILAQTISASDKTVSSISQLSAADSVNTSSGKEIPPTITVDKTKKNEFHSNRIFNYSYINQEKTTENTETNKLADIFTKYEYYSDVSKGDAAFIFEKVKISKKDLIELEALGMTLSDSIILAMFSVKNDIPIKDIYEDCSSFEDIKNLATQLVMYVCRFSKDIIGGDIDKELRKYLLKGYTFSQVKAAYGISSSLGISISKLLTDSDDKTIIKKLSESDIGNYRYLAKKFGVNVNALAEYAVKNDLSFDDMKEIVTEAVTDSPLFNSSNSGLLRTSSSGGPIDLGGDAHDSYLGAPFSYNYNDAESVNMNTGLITYETVDYTLPGINGLDLVIGRRYDSSKANVYYPHYLSAGDGVISTDPFAADIQIIYSITPNDHFDEQYGLGQGWSLMFSSIEFTESTTDPGIMVKLLHLADGRTFTIDNNNDLVDYTLNDLRFEQESGGYAGAYYTLYYKDGKKEHFSYNGDLMGIRDRFGNTISFAHSMSYGYPCITITDTMNRNIIISGQSTTGGHTMTVSLPNSVSLSYKVNEYTNYDTLTEYNDPMNTPTYYSYTESEGGFGLLPTVLGPLLSNPFLLQFVLITGDNTNYFVNLSTITYPTGVQTSYSYEGFARNLGAFGGQSYYRLTQRQDIAESQVYNQKLYAYSTDNYTGYPSYNGGRELPSEFTYYTTETTTVTNVSAKYTFDYQHHLKLKEETVVENNVVKKIQDIAYFYDSNDLPIKENLTKYNYTDQSQNIEIKKSYAYDGYGNITASWSPLADGATNNTVDNYKTTYTYNTTYSLPLSISYKQDANTTITKQYTLDSS